MIWLIWGIQEIDLIVFIDWQLEKSTIADC